MRQFGSVVESLVLPVFNTGHDFSFCCSVAFQLVGDNDTRNIGHPFQKLAEETLGSFPIASGLHQNIERITILIQRPPELVVLSLDSEYHLFQMQFISSSRLPSSK